MSIISPIFVSSIVNQPKTSPNLNFCFHKYCSPLDLCIVTLPVDFLYLPWTCAGPITLVGFFFKNWKIYSKNEILSMKSWKNWAKKLLIIQNWTFFHVLACLPKRPIFGRNRNLKGSPCLLSIYSLEPGLFSCRKKRQCWDVTGKWSKRKCARPLSASVKVCTSFRGCVYCRFRAAGMYWDVGTCPSPFIWQISLVLIQLGGILWPPHRLVPAKIFDLPAPLLCKPYYLICTYTKSKTNGVSCWL